MSESSVEMDISDIGIDPREMEETGELEYVVTPHPLLLSQTLVARAKSWVGHKFHGDEKEQCANFIRRLLKEAGFRVPPAKKPFDFHLTEKLEQGPSFANSFFSAENGTLLGFSDLQPGDLVAFRDTYKGDFPEGCITHVAIWVSEGSMVDRATAGDPVREIVLNKWWKTRFVVGLRPRQLCSKL